MATKSASIPGGKEFREDNTGGGVSNPKGPGKMEKRLFTIQRSKIHKEERKSFRVMTIRIFLPGHERGSHKNWKEGEKKTPGGGFDYILSKKKKEGTGLSKSAQ